ncbi:hypothetical protein GCM10008022_18670 [Paenibacillus hunanensis]|nr:hypothetical protein GCM10008022_18670 [Paenibacillus hunanensis]
MAQPNILTKDEVMTQGTEFTDNVCYSGLSGQELYNRPVEEGGEPISGLVYEKNRDGNIAYYAHYINGIEEGEYVEFFDNGLPVLYRQMIKGTVYGMYISWHENKRVKIIAQYRHGFKTSYKEWDKSGIIIKEKVELSSFEKEMIEKYDNWSRQN